MAETTPTANGGDDGETAITGRAARRDLPGLGPGLTPDTLARTFDLTVAEVEEIVRVEMEKQPLPSQLDPEEVLREHEVRLYAVQEELAMIASREKGLARTRAVEARFKAQKHLFEVGQAIGVLPRDLGQMAVHIDGVTMVERFMVVLKEFGVPHEAYEALRRAIRPNRERTVRRQRWAAPPTRFVMNAPERLRRDLAISFEARAGIRYRDIAERYGISVKTVQRAIKRVEGKNSR